MLIPFWLIFFVLWLFFNAPWMLWVAIGLLGLNVVLAIISAFT